MGVGMNHAHILRTGCLLLLAGTPLPALSATPCAALKDFRMAGQAVQIDNAQPVAAGPMAGGPPGPMPRANLPAYCKVDGTIDKRTGRNGKPYAIGFSV